MNAPTTYNYGTDKTGKPVYESSVAGGAVNSSSAVPSATISSSTLAPVTPYNIPTPKVEPTTGNLAIGTDTHAATIAQDAAYTPPDNPAKNDLSVQLKALQGDFSGQAAQENQIRNDQQLYEKKQKATAVSNQMDQMDKAYRDEVNQIRKNAAGTFGGAVDQQIATATDRYQNNRANLALTYKVFAGDYNDAQQIVQDKISALQTQHSQQLQAYQLAASAVNNDLTDSEKIQVQANITKKQNDAKLIQDAYSTVLQQAVQNQAPVSVLSAIDTASHAPGATAATVMAAAGQYGIDRYKQAQTANENRLASGGGSSSTIASHEVTAFKTMLNESKFNGSEADGKYADPSLYLEHYTNWKDSGGDPATFFKSFPPGTYINPANTWLPEEIMKFVNKTGSSSNSSGAQIP